MAAARAEHLRVLGLDAGSSLDESVLKKAYFRRALKCHPDKGGSKEEFQRLQQAYDSLLKAHTAPTSHDHPSTSHYDPYESDDDNYYCDARTFWEDWFSNFFSAFTGAFDGESDYAYQEFSRQHEKTAKERAKERQANVKERFDWRDKEVRESQTVRKRKAQATTSKSGLRLRCSHVDKNGKACPRAAITRTDAVPNGLNWVQYVRHPKVADGTYATCWACKNAHDTVIT